jgi:hypothetical protein
MTGPGRSGAGRTSILKRAFELARTGEIPTVQAIKRRLKEEGYLGIKLHLEGRVQLREANPTRALARGGANGHFC